VVAAEIRLFPNPIVDRLEVRFALPEPAPARLSIFDVSGREVAPLTEGFADRRMPVISWSPDPSQAPGLYYVRLESERGSATQRFTLIR
jgi:hypothetical protein